MFNVAVKYIGFLKHIPFVAQTFEGGLKLLTLCTNPKLLDVIDEIENEVGAWPGVTLSNHKYGGLQFNKNSHEMGHVHGNGMLDILLTRTLKEQLITEGKVNEHHTIKNSGWCSFKINGTIDKPQAVELLKEAYLLRC